MTPDSVPARVIFFCVLLDTVTVSVCILCTTVPCSDKRTVPVSERSIIVWVCTLTGSVFVYKYISQEP